MKKQILLSLFVVLFGSLMAQTDTTGIKNDTIPALDCDYTKNEVDDFTGDTKIVTKKENFIAHTDSSLMKYYKKKRRQYFEVETYTARINDVKAIYLYIVIQTKKAYDYYGVLSSDAKVMFKMSDGSMIELKVGSSDYGDTNYDYNYTSFSTYLVVDDSDVESFQTLDVEKVRIYWSKGYEDYECSNPSLLKKQFNCIK
jgi:hypothetical protein